MIHNPPNMNQGFHPLICNCRRDVTDTEQSTNLSGHPAAKWRFRILYVIRTRARAIETKPSCRANCCQEKIYSEKTYSEVNDEVRCVPARVRPSCEPQDAHAGRAASRSAWLRFSVGRRSFGDAVENRHDLSLQQGSDFHRAAGPAV